MTTDPTRTTYQGLTEAYDFFNERLFGGRLPRCLITMQRQRGAYGYFAGKRFGTRDGQEVTDEIALNPAHFRSRTTRRAFRPWRMKCATLSRIISERRPQGVSQPGMGRDDEGNRPHSERYRAAGRQGNRAEGEPLHRDRRAFRPGLAELETSGFAVRYVELWGDEQARKKKAASKTKYTCPACGLNAWASRKSTLFARLRRAHERGRTGRGGSED